MKYFILTGADCFGRQARDFALTPLTPPSPSPGRGEGEEHDLSDL